VQLNIYKHYYLIIRRSSISLTSVAVFVLSTEKVRDKLTLEIKKAKVVINVFVSFSVKIVYFVCVKVNFMTHAFCYIWQTILFRPSLNG